MTSGAKAAWLSCPPLPERAGPLCPVALSSGLWPELNAADVMEATDRWLSTAGFLQARDSGLLFALDRNHLKWPNVTDFVLGVEVERRLTSHGAMARVVMSSATVVSECHRIVDCERRVSRQVCSSPRYAGMFAALEWAVPVVRQLLSDELLAGSMLHQALMLYVVEDQQRG